MILDVGKEVYWESGAGYGWTRKRGKIVAVIPAGIDPTSAVMSALKEHGARSAFGGGRARGHDSYLVLVPHHGKGKPTIYWPLVSSLRYDL